MVAADVDVCEACDTDDVESVAPMKKFMNDKSICVILSRKLSISKINENFTWRCFLKKIRTNCGLCDRCLNGSFR